MTTAMEAYRAARSTRVKRKRRPAVAVLGAALVSLATLAGRRIPSFAAVRRVLLSVGGFGALSYAAWLFAAPLGYAVVGLSLLILEYLSGGEG